MTPRTYGTGHPSRLHRKILRPFGSRDYVRKELVVRVSARIEAATGWEDRAVADGIARVLGKINGASRNSTLRRATDRLISLGESAPFWRAQEVIPTLLALIEVGGDSFTLDQIVRLVGRGETYSRIGVNGLVCLYDHWPEQAANLGLPAPFEEMGLEQVAWYCAMRERFASVIQGCFVFELLNKQQADLSHAGLVLRLDSETKDFLMSKWPNRGRALCLIAFSSKDMKAWNESRRVFWKPFETK